VYLNPTPFQLQFQLQLQLPSQFIAPHHRDLAASSGPPNSHLGRDRTGMAEESSQPSVTGPGTPKAPKDKSCPYCHQAFTSSSLGRHLDLYIKEKNPKAPDGVHNVDEIRRLRGGVTRRQAKGPFVRRRNTSVSVGTPTAASKRSPGSEGAESSMVKSPLSQADAAQFGRRYPWNTPWEATGVMNDISAGGGEAGKRNERDEEVEGSRSGLQRAASRQAIKQQFEARQRMQDALDTARAAELALRELIGSWRAAKSVSRIPEPVVGVL